MAEGSKTSYSREDLDRYFDYNIFPAKRILFLGSCSYQDGVESGVDHDMFAYFLKGLTYLDSTAEEPIVVHMNTDGGDVSHGMAIYDAIRACRSHVSFVVWGSAMSMGCVILQAADTRYVSRDCVLMIHDGNSVLGGHTRNVERWAERSKQFRRRMYEIYLGKMMRKNKTMTLKKVENLCMIDTIYGAEEAVNVGLADHVLDNFEVLKGE